VVVIGGIISGVFTATEASAIAVAYSLLLSLCWYREIGVTDLPKIFIDSVVTTSIVLFLIGCSIAMSRAMAFGDIPLTISSFMIGISDNPIIILLCITVVLLVIGTFMDMTPALLIFTPILMPVMQDLGIDPVHFGIIMTINLCVGICTPASRLSTVCRLLHQWREYWSSDETHPAILFSLDSHCSAGDLRSTNQLIFAPAYFRLLTSWFQVMTTVKS